MSEWMKDGVITAEEPNQKTALASSHQLILFSLRRLWYNRKLKIFDQSWKVIGVEG